MGQKRVRLKLTGPKLYPWFLMILIFYFIRSIAVVFSEQTNKTKVDQGPAMEYPITSYRD